MVPFFQLTLKKKSYHEMTDRVHEAGSRAAASC